MAGQCELPNTFFYPFNTLANAEGLCHHVTMEYGVVKILTAIKDIV